MQQAIILTREETSVIQERAQVLFTSRRPAGAASWANTSTKVRDECTAEVMVQFRQENQIPASLGVLLQTGDNRFVKH